jgi:Flp pilus assembly protein TadG
MKRLRNARRTSNVFSLITHLRKSETGTSLLETAFALPVFILLLIGSIDFGRAWYADIEVASASEAGALYGVQNITDTAGMQAAATLDAADVVSVSPVASYGCECSDGSSVTPSCSTTPSCTTNVVNYVQVTTNSTYTPLFPYPGISASFALSSTSRMRAGQ